MPRTVRSINLDLIRWLNLGHEPTAKLLAPVTNATYLSKMATGEMEIGDRKARAIERAAGLPPGWLDRDNVGHIQVSAVDYELLALLAPLDDAAKGALKTLLAAIRGGA